MYLDEKGLIVQQDGDAGDCLQREGFWSEGTFLNTPYVWPSNMASYPEAMAILKTPQGFVRSWQPRGGPPPWNTPSDCSRDQLVSNIRALGYFQQTTLLSYIRDGILKNWSRYPNGDIAFVNDYGRLIRAFRAWYLWPLLLICDLPLIVNSIIRCIAGINYDNVGDDVNHIGDLAQCQHTMPTPISFIARKIYKWFRPKGPQYALDWYFRPQSKANPEFAQLWAPIVANF